MNELRGGLIALYGYSRFGADSSNGPATFADQGGYAISFPLSTSWYTSNSPSWRHAPCVWHRETKPLLKTGPPSIHLQAYTVLYVSEESLGMC